MLLATGGAMTLHSGARRGAPAGAAAAALRRARAAPPSSPRVGRVEGAALPPMYDVGTRCNSAATIMNAYHHRSDALSSVVALVGIGGAMAGWVWLDPLAATAVGGMRRGWASRSRSRRRHRRAVAAPRRARRAPPARRCRSSSPCSRAVEALFEPPRATSSICPAARSSSMPEASDT